MSEYRDSVDDMPDVQVYPLRRAEYDLLVEQGAFGADERLQLLDGELVALSPQKPLHAAVVESLTARLVPALVGRPPAQRRQEGWSARSAAQRRIDSSTPLT